MNRRSLAVLALALALGCARRSAPRKEPPVAVVESPAVAAPASGTLPASTPAPARPDPDCPAGLTCDPDAFDHGPRPRITEVLVQKRAHRLHLVAGAVVVKSYRVALGSGGLGQKRVEGDRVTPIGSYTITGRYPSRWHTYLALSYPNDEDRKRFADRVARGEVEEKLGPGSAIAIHGHRADQNDRLHKARDWTLGCIALDRAEIDEVADAAPVGTKVVIEE